METRSLYHQGVSVVDFPACVGLWEVLKGGGRGLKKINTEK